MRFASLGSGSRGNSLVVEAGRTRVMVDCGFGLSDTLRRLSRLGLEPSDLTAIVVTHEHTDHLGGVARLARKFAVPVWLTQGTLKGLADEFFTSIATHPIDDHSIFSIGDLEIQPYPIPHDAREPAQYVFGNGNRRLGILTDTGASTLHIEATLSGCDALWLESNHDSTMLQSGNYPYSLKQRVAGKFGHLDNVAAARLLSVLAHDKLQQVVAAHLSEKNNRPELVCAAFSAALGCEEEWIGIADQEHGLDWREIV